MNKQNARFLDRIKRGDLCAGCGGCALVAGDAIAMETVPPGFLRPVQRAPLSPETDPAAIKAIHRALDAESEITIDILNYRKDGTKFWNRLRIRPLYGDDGKVMFYAGVQNPIDASEVRLGPSESSET